MKQREIKFRIWDTYCKEFIYTDFDYLELDDEFDRLTLKCSKVRGDHGSRDRWIVMQVTGLFDKNGKEIYEGDIVKYKTYFRNTEVIREVEWSDGITGFDPFADYDADCDIYVHGKDVEVIGNIYENPELMKS